MVAFALDSRAQIISKRNTEQLVRANITPLIPFSQLSPETMSSVGSPTMGFYSTEDWDKIYEDVDIRKEDLNKLVMNFLVKEGYASAAEKFFEETGIAPAKNLPKISVHASVVKAILFHNIEDAFKVVETSHPEVLIPNARLFINLGQLQWRELIHKGNEEAASRFYQEHIAPLVEASPSFKEEWLEFVQKSTEGSFDGPVRSILEEGQLVKMVIDELKLIRVTAYPDEMKDSKMTSMIKMLKKAQFEFDDYCYYPHQDLE